MFSCVEVSYNRIFPSIEYFRENEVFEVSKICENTDLRVEIENADPVYSHVYFLSLNEV